MSFNFAWLLLLCLTFSFFATGSGSRKSLLVARRENDPEIKPTDNCSPKSRQVPTQDFLPGLDLTEVPPKSDEETDYDDWDLLTATSPTSEMTCPDCELVSNEDECPNCRQKILHEGHQRESRSYR